MGKSLTFLSIIIGFLLGFLEQTITNFVKAVKATNFFKAVSSINYSLLVVSLVVVTIIGCLFFLIEREQTEKSSKETKTTNELLKAIAQRLGVDVDALMKKIEEENKSGKPKPITKPEHPDNKPKE